MSTIVMRVPRKPDVKPMTKQVIRTKRKDGSTRVRVISKDFGPSRTDQSFSEESDVNFIMKKYLSTGHLSHRRDSQGVFADLTQGNTDLMSAFTIVKEAELLFSELPADVRSKFGNNPLDLEQWLLDPKNTEESIKLGLRNPPPEKKSAESILSDEKPPVGKNQKSQKPQKPQSTESEE